MNLKMIKKTNKNDLLIAVLSRFFNLNGEEK